MAMAATGTIFVNALFLQRGPHPAPLFSSRTASVEMPAEMIAPKPGAFAPLGSQSIVSNRFTAAPLAPVRTPAAALRPRQQVIADIQKELTRRGFYDGATDGVWGGQTDAALRDFADQSGLKFTAEASEETLRVLAASNVKAAPKSAPRPDPIAELIAPSKRVIAVQRVLADYAYGQIKPTGTLDTATRAAIEKYEREHKMPVTGEVSDRLVRSLAAMTGRAID